MKFFKKQNEAKPSSTLPRLKKLRTEELLSWASVTIMSLGQAFDGYRYHDEPLEEVILSADVLMKILQEVQERVDITQKAN